MKPRSPRARIALTLVAALGALGVERATAPPEPLFSAPSSALLLARDGELLGAKVASDGQWRFAPAPGDAVPHKFERALILAEDRRFHAHPGVDPLALARAARLNLAQLRIASGGSTLTMQLARLAQDNPPRTLGEKLREMVMALRIEAHHDKREILALYAAHAPFGGNVVGLEAAAWRHFGRAPAALSWAEAALLAVLPRDPARLHPGRDREQLRTRRDALLARLHACGDLSDVELALALREPLPERAHELPREAPHLFETLLARRDRADERIPTTLDARLQQRTRELAAEHARGLERRGIHNLAVLIVDNASFEVRAYVGNSDPADQTARGRAVDVVQRPRSTGSILKPLLFAAMLESGELLPDTLVPDVPTQFGSYRPENFDRSFRGAVPASEALARSLNVPAVHLLSRHGVDRFQGLLQRLGMRLPRPAEDYGLTLVLGGAEGTLWEIASLYANLAHLAQSRPPRSALHYRTLRTLHGVAEQRGALAEIGPGAAWLTLQALLEGERPAEASPWRRFQSDQPIAWKTGTSYGLRDAWAVGVTAEATVAVWAGNASGEGVPGLTGIDAAAPLVFALFAELGAVHAPAQPVEDLRPVSVCADDGYLATPLCAARTAWIPLQSRFAQSSPFHRRVYVATDGAWQVHAGCEALDRMAARSFFVLPPAQEAFYRQLHADYRSVPPARPDCRDASAASAELEVLYPPSGARLYIPVDLTGARSRAVLEAVHRRPDAVLYWHLDGEFLGETRHFHRWPLDAAPGKHRLTLIDDRGYSLERRFEILGASDDASAATP